MHRYIVHMKHDRGFAKIMTAADDADTATKLVCKAEYAPRNAAIAVYRAEPCPKLGCEFGAPMGRASDAPDYDSPRRLWRARAVRLNAGGYDRGGAYWGHRSGGKRLYAVQDGVGNLMFTDAASSRDAISHFLD